MACSLALAPPDCQTPLRRNAGETKRQCPSRPPNLQRRPPSSQARLHKRTETNALCGGADQKWAGVQSEMDMPPVGVRPLKFSSLPAQHTPPCPSGSPLGTDVAGKPGDAATRGTVLQGSAAAAAAPGGAAGSALRVGWPIIPGQKNLDRNTISGPEQHCYWSIGGLT